MSASAPASQGTETLFRVSDYDLGRTLQSGQAFRWTPDGGAWVGVIGRHWVSLQNVPSGILARTAEPVREWGWLREYLQLEVDLRRILGSLPSDEPLRAAMKACPGLRLLRQDLWECLGSFILSSTKQILQIRQVISILCERFGDTLKTPPGCRTVASFPSAQRIASLREADLRDCKMGFRAPYLLETARLIAGGKFELEHPRELPLPQAREELMRLPGVGPKIADCVLLFAYGFDSAFPLDVWMMKALRQLYFPRKRISVARMRCFAESHFGPYAGYAQQYLFHYMRTVYAKNGSALHAG